MAKEVSWNRIIYDEFVRFALLTDFEKEVLKTRLQNKTIIEQSLLLHCSKSTIDRTIKKLKKKYDEVQPYSDILPKRRTSEKENYLDTH